MYFCFEKSWQAISKKGSVARGEKVGIDRRNVKWSEDTQFHLKDKRAVRGWWVLLQKKYKTKMHHEETASGISVDEIFEIDVLLEELVGKEESLNQL